MFSDPTSFSRRFNVATETRPKFVIKSSNEYKDNKVFDNMRTIPKIIHQTNKDNFIPSVFKVSYQLWKPSEEFEFELIANSLGAHIETHRKLTLRKLSYLTVNPQDDSHCDFAVSFP